jgi:hypothetical protein
MIMWFAENLGILNEKRRKSTSIIYVLILFKIELYNIILESSIQQIMLKNVSSQNNKKYLPPRHSTNPPAAEKKSLKKEFSLQLEAFPALTNTSSIKPSVLSFAQAAQTTPVKNAVSTTEALLPGWLYIRQHNGKIEYKSGPTDPQRYPYLETEEEEDIRLSHILLKYRLAREQYERDNDVLHLGDYSEYYNVKTLQEQYDEDYIAMLKMDSRSSDNSDSE